MRILNRKQFLELPEGVVFAKYTPTGEYGMLCRKFNTFVDGSGVPSDFDYQNMTSEVGLCGDEFFKVMEDAEENGTSYRLDFYCGNRDGFFDQDQLFAVWEQQDIESLREYLGTCIGVDEVENAKT